MQNKEEQKQHLIDMMRGDEELGLYDESKQFVECKCTNALQAENCNRNCGHGLEEEPKQENCCTPIGQIKRYVNCVSCDRKPEQSTSGKEFYENSDKVVTVDRQKTVEKVKPKDIQRIIASTNAQTASIEILQLFTQHQTERMYSEEDIQEYESWVKDAEKESNLSDLNDRANAFWSGYRAGIKFKKRMYNEEEVIVILEQAMKDCHTEGLDMHYSGNYKYLKDWFEQFKKK